MGFQFAETMSGTFSLDHQPGVERFFSFTVHAVAPSLRTYLRDQRVELTGTLEAEGFAEGVPCEGSMRMSPVIHRVIRYELSFVADDGRPYRFEGQKDIRVTALRRSFTEMPGALYDETGRQVGTANTRFDLTRDWLTFLSSWRPA